MLFGAAAASRSAQMRSLATSLLLGDRPVWTETVQITVYLMGGGKFPINDKNTHIYKAIGRIRWMHPTCLFRNTGLLHKQNKKADQFHKIQPVQHICCSAAVGSKCLRTFVKFSAFPQCVHEALASSCDHLWKLPESVCRNIPATYKVHVVPFNKKENKSGAIVAVITAFIMQLAESSVINSWSF